MEITTLLSILCIFFVITFAIAVTSFANIKKAAQQVKWDREANRMLKSLSGKVIIKIEITSKITGITYPVSIYLPPGYNESDTEYKIIYKTDGQWFFEYYAWQLEKYDRKYILVGVEQGPWERRMTDYMYFGADDYYNFFSTELIPEIESMYRVDTKNRTMIGASAGGFFSAWALKLDNGETPLFRNHLIIDTPFYWAMINQSSTPLPYNYWSDAFSEMYSKNPTLNVNIILTYSYPRGHEASTRFFYDDLKNPGFEGMRLFIEGFETTHEQIPGPSFIYMLENVLKE